MSYQEKSYNFFDYHNLEQQEQNMFERTACFKVDFNKENKNASAIYDTSNDLDISTETSPIKKTRPRSRERPFIIKNKIIPDPKDLPFGEHVRGRSNKTSPHRLSFSRNGMRDKDSFKDFVNAAGPREPSSAQPSAKRSEVKALSILLPVQKEQGKDDATLNFTFSPTKKQATTDLKNELKCLRSESCVESRNLDQKRDNSQEKAFQRAMKPARNRKYSPNVGKLNRIRVLSPIPHNNPNNSETNCFSPQLMRKMKEIPHSVLDFDHPNTLDFENKTEVMYPKFNYYPKKLSLNPTVHNTSLCKNDQQPPSPLQYSTGRPPVYIRDDIKDSRPSPSYLIEEKWKNLPLITLSRKGESNPVKPVVVHYKLQNVDERWGSLKRQRPSIPFVNLTNKSGIHNYKGGLDDSPSIIVDRAEVVSAGIDSQMGNGLRFRAQEMILNKLFKPLN